MDFKELCKVNPQFVIARYDKSGWSLDDTVKYEGPFASHELSQASGYEHPSLMVKSNWDLDTNKSISGVITGKKGKQVLGGGPTNLIRKNGKLYIVSGKSNASAASISDIRKILSKYSQISRNIPYRGSPLEYKRILDYLQFYATKKVDDDSSLYFARPNNLSLMDKIRGDSNKIENIYNALIEDKSPKVFSKAYFVSYDKIAAFASVVRNIPTLFVKATETNAPRTYVKIAKKKSYEENAKIIRDLILYDLKNAKLILYDLKNAKLKMGGPDIDKNGIILKPIISVEVLVNKETITLPLITQGDLFGWFLHVENLYKVSGKFISNVSLKTLILFYWIFFYPNAIVKGNGKIELNNTLPNMKIIEYFLTIADTFHDFGKESENFKESWSENINFKTAKSTSETGISTNHKPKTSNKLKFIVKLLGADIYRAVGRYNENVLKTLSATNTRNENKSKKELTPGLKVAHFLYLIANIFGHQKSGFVKETEEYGKQLMIRMGKGYIKGNESNLCKELNTERACVVVDAIEGSLPECMKELSVYHNVGVFDTASKDILSWGNLSTPNGCPKYARRKPSTARPKTARPLGVQGKKGVTKKTTIAVQRLAEEKAAEVKAARRAATIKRLIKEKAARNAANAAAKEKAARNAANAAAKEKADRNARVAKRNAEKKAAEKKAAEEKAARNAANAAAENKADKKRLNEYLNTVIRDINKLNKTKINNVIKSMNVLNKRTNINESKKIVMREIRGKLQAQLEKLSTAASAIHRTTRKRRAPDNGQETAKTPSSPIPVSGNTARPGTPARGNGQEMMNINNPSVTAIPGTTISARRRTPAPSKRPATARR